LFGTEVQGQHWKELHTFDIQSVSDPTTPMVEACFERDQLEQLIPVGLAKSDLLNA
jgi:hypothetical protein